MHLYDGLDGVSSCLRAVILDKTPYYWRKKFGDMGCSQLSKIRPLPKENAQLKKTLIEQQLERLILKESPDHLKPKA